jgi:hypothetical protein
MLKAKNTIDLFTSSYPPNRDSTLSKSNKTPLTLTPSTNETGARKTLLIMIFANHLGVSAALKGKGPSCRVITHTPLNIDPPQSARHL